ncbi:MAG: oligosaccharide flippase family protein [Candidatus Heimdallarchaeota archaeon]|nr:oligosaccharide flippase family protein [Candidatus Heimdallarchaeota archaeon]MCK5048675.1 oligosaccharide flippase family protein [Candidatus Heimdallarchaeota archaeon]
MNDEADLSITGQKKSLFQQSSIVLLARGYSIGLIFLQTIIYIAIVGIDDFGLFAIANATVILGINLGPFGLDKVIVRQLASERVNSSKELFSLGNILLVNAINSFMVGGILWFSSPWLGTHFIGIERLSEIIQIASIYFVFMAFYTVLSVIHQALLEIQIVALSQIIFKTVGTVVGVLLGLTMGIEGIVYSLGIYPLGGGIMLFINLWKKNNLSKKITKDIFTLEKETLAFGVIALVRFGPPWIVLGIIGKFYGDAEMGLYTIALQFLALPAQISQSINYALLPRTTLKTQISSLTSIGSNISNVIKYSISIQILISIGGLIWAPEIFILFGEGKAAIPAFLILFIFAPLIVGIGDILHDGVIIGIEKPAILILIELIYGIFVLILTWVLVESFGAEGAALSFVLAWLVLLFLIVLRLRVYFPKQYTSEKIFSRKNQEITLYYTLFLLVTFPILETGIGIRLLFSLLIYTVMIIVIYYRILTRQDRERLLKLRKKNITHLLK